MTYSRGEVEAEYDSIAGREHEFEKLNWGSQEGMMNRFELAMRELPFDRAKTWLDVGCGTGAFQAIAAKAFPNISAKAIDISKKLLDVARSRDDVEGARFAREDFLEIKDETFDLLTCIGVLQKTTFTPQEFFEHARESLAPKGRVLLDTKNAGWKRFEEPGFHPESGHQWFEPEDLVSAATDAGLVVLKVRGFLPRENKVVDPGDSHTVFLIAES